MEATRVLIRYQVESYAEKHSIAAKKNKKEEEEKKTNNYTGINSLPITWKVRTV